MGYEQEISIDPKDVPDDPLAYRAWLHRQATIFTDIIIRSRNKTMSEPRLERMLMDVLVAIGTAVGPNTRHQPASKSASGSVSRSDSS